MVRGAWWDHKESDTPEWLSAYTHEWWFWSLGIFPMAAPIKRNPQGPTCGHYSLTGPFHSLPTKLRMGQVSLRPPQFSWGNLVSASTSFYHTFGFFFKQIAELWQVCWHRFSSGVCSLSVSGSRFDDSLISQSPLLLYLLRWWVTLAVNHWYCALLRWQLAFFSFLAV